MELSFVIKALQRRWWIVVLFSLLGAIPGAMLDNNSDTVEFESTAVLLVSPPTTAQTINLSGDPDRYVQGQLNVLESSALATEVAIVVGDDPETSDVGQSTDFEQVNDTDIVVITSTASVPGRAVVVTQAFVDTYISALETSAATRQQPEIEAFDRRLEEIENELNEVNRVIEERMQPFVISRDAIPDINAIVPDEASSRVLLIDEFNRVQTAKNELELSGLLRINTEVVQNASEALPLTSSNSLLIVGGYIVGAMLGLVVALIWAQFSPYLIASVSVSDVTGPPVVGTFTRSRVMRTNPLMAAQQARGRTLQTLAQVAVRSEALGSVERPLVIACIGPRLGAGATTSSLAVAGRFAQQGSLVTVLDADDRDRALSQRHGDPESGGLAKLVDCIEEGVGVESDLVLSPTKLGGVNIIGQGEEMSVLRRANARAVVQTAALFGDVLIIDGGPLLGSAAVIEACRYADAIVLAVPLKKQLRNQLSDVIAQLGVDRSKVLTVISEPSSQGFFKRS
ncbi:MAG: hypothetical protein ACR2PK_15190 [Acidimicrobiales bacterium]